MKRKTAINNRTQKALHAEFEILQLQNGLKIIHQYAPSPAAHCGFLVNAGSRDETEHQHGLAHFLEHSLFKGTRKRKAFHVLNRIDVVGGELNAYTGKEDTVIHASFLPQHFERAIELLCDITFNATFPEKEISKEKEIIKDEIFSYLDSPGDQIFDDFEDLLFTNHSLGRPILGTAESVQQLTRTDLLEFQQQLYQPQNMVFASVGSVPAPQIKAWLERYMNVSLKSAGRAQRALFNCYKPRQQTVPKGVNQAHFMLGNVAFPLNHEYRRAMVLLNNILGGPAMNSRLNLNISEKYGFAYNLESNYTAYSDTGIFSVYLGTDANSLDKAVQLIEKELKRLRDQALGIRQLSSAKDQLKGQIALNQESGASMMIGLGKSLLSFDKVDNLNAIYHDIDRITATDLLEIANLVFNPNALSHLVYVPQNN